MRVPNNPILETKANIEIDGIESCTICGELCGRYDIAAWPQLANRKVPSRIIEESQHFAIAITLGPIVEGHCLLIPKKHVHSMSACSDSEKKEAVMLLAHVSRTLKDIYEKPVLYFEHGAVEGQSCKPCSIGHAHWHLIPTEVRPWDLWGEDEKWEKVVDPFAHRSADYLLTGGESRGYWILHLAHDVPSQLLRRRLAIKLNKEQDWDWKHNIGIERMLSSIEYYEKNAVKYNL